MFSRNQQIEVEVTGLAFGGKGIAKIPTERGEYTVFVQNALPGQKVRARVVKRKARYAETKLEEVLRRAPEEVTVLYQEIPGAPYARLPIAEQTAYKRENAVELYRRIGGEKRIDDLLEEYIESPEIWHYRNKMEYSFSVIRFDLEEKQEHDDFGLGFKHRGTWWAVENLDADSGLFDQEFENKLKDIRIWLEKTGLPAWHPPRREGFFRYVVVRKSYHTGELLMNFVTSSHGLDQFDMDGFIAHCRSLLGDRLAGIMHTINDETGDRVDPSAGKIHNVFGVSQIVERLNGLDFEISMSSFFQTNPRCAEKLYQRVIDYVGTELPEGQVVLDLFCGTGTIGQLVARHSGCPVVGVDIVESAIRDARANAERNGIEGVEFHAADVGRFLLEYPQYQGKLHTVILDPPRGGIAPKTLRKVIRLQAKRLVYVSCNPATQARDMSTLRDAGYVLKRMTLVDQFPHTAHIEAVALFEQVNDPYA